MSRPQFELNGTPATFETKLEAQAKDDTDAKEMKLIMGAINLAISRGIRDGFERVKRQQETGHQGGNR